MSMYNGFNQIVVAAVAAVGRNGFIQPVEDQSPDNITGTGSAGQVAYFTGAQVIAGDSGLTYNATTNVLTAGALEMSAGSTVAVSSASSGRIRYNESTNALQVSLNGAAYVDVATGAGVAIGATVTGGTAGRVLYVGAGPVLAQDAGLTYSDSTDTLTLAGSDATADPRLIMSQASTGDAALRFAIGSSTSYAVGADNSAANDPFTISYAASGTAVLGTGNLMQISKGGIHTEFIFSDTPTGTTYLELLNLNTGLANHAELLVQVPDGAGDAYAKFSATAVAWYVGIDNSASDGFAISATGIGTSNAISITTGLTATFGGQIITTTTGTLAAITIGSLNGDPSSLSNGDIWYSTSTNTLRARVNGASVSIATGTAGVTLDGAYDFGGAGSGRTITVDSGAVQLTGSGTTVGGFTVDGSRTIASAASAVWNEVLVDADVSISGSTDITTATGFNMVALNGPTITDAGTVNTIANSASFYIGAAPTGSGVTITNAYALWVDAGESRFDGQIVANGGGGAAAPDYAFEADEDTGSYRAAANQWAVATGGTNRLTLSSSAATFAVNILLPSDISSSSDTNTGMVWGGSDILTLRCGSQAIITMNANATSCITTFEQIARTSGGSSNSTWLFTGPAHLDQSASTEIIDIDFDLDATLQHQTGALTTQRSVVFRPRTYSFAGGSTLTNAATVAITGAPIAGANATLTTTYSLWIQGGQHIRADGTSTIASAAGAVWNAVLFDMDVSLSGSTNVTTATGFNMVTLNQPTITDAGTIASITNAATLYIGGAPTGSGLTLTNAYALWVDSGNARFDGQVFIDLGDISNTGLAFLGDVNTGLYQSVADSMAISAGGLSQITIDGGGGGTTSVEVNLATNSVSFGVYNNSSVRLISTDPVASGLGFGANAGGTAQFMAVTATVKTSGVVESLIWTGAAHTGQTAGTEVLDVNWNFTATLQHASNTAVTLQRSFIIQPRTYSFASATGTITNAFTMEITGRPIAGTNATLTSSAALRVIGGCVIGSAALATNATSGFLYIPTCAGTPTGVPETQTGTAAMVLDTTNNILYVYDGAWLGVAVA